MTLLNSLAGMVTVSITGAEPGQSLQAITDLGIRVYDAEFDGELTVRFCIIRQDAAAVHTICEKRGDSFKITGNEGFFWELTALLKRPVLVVTILIGFVLTLWLPTRVLFLSVEGNKTIPSRQILETAEDCGIRFGASRRSVRSERMKNALLAAMPELKWAGVNTSGCTAVISVREREPEIKGTESLSFSNIVADRDGYITSCTATRGNLLCAPGQVVEKGQLLISGFTDCGLCIRAEAAEGEIFAQTRRQITAVTPGQRTIRVREGEAMRFYSLILGKKRINLWKDSGIWDATCGRMYEEYYITLPGGFRLPVALAVETVTQWDTADVNVTAVEAKESLSFFVRAAVKAQMTAGMILQESMELTQEKGCYFLHARFLCEEMIGRVITQEIGETNGKTD